jgi:WD40 repeat protein
VEGVALSADGRLAISASIDILHRGDTLKIWDIPTGRELRTLAGDSGVVPCVALSADGRLAVSASPGETLKVWDVPTGRELCTLAGHSDYVRDVALSADGQLAVSADNKTIKVWDISAAFALSESERLNAGVLSGCCIATLLVGASLNCCAISADGKTIVAGDALGGVHFLELVGAGEIQSSDQEKVEARSPRLPRWLKGLFESTKK